MMFLRADHVFCHPPWAFTRQLEHPEYEKRYLMAGTWPWEIFHGHLAATGIKSIGVTGKATWFPWKSTLLDENLTLEKNSQQDRFFFIARPHLFHWQALYYFLPYLASSLLEIAVKPQLGQVTKCLAANGQRLAKNPWMSVPKIGTGFSFLLVLCNRNMSCFFQTWVKKPKYFHLIQILRNSTKWPPPPSPHQNNASYWTTTASSRQWTANQLTKIEVKFKNHEKIQRQKPIKEILFQNYNSRLDDQNGLVHFLLCLNDGRVEYPVLISHFQMTSI